MGRLSRSIGLTVFRNVLEVMDILLDIVSMFGPLAHVRLVTISSLMMNNT